MKALDLIELHAPPTLMPAAAARPSPATTAAASAPSSSVEDQRRLHAACCAERGGATSTVKCPGVFRWKGNRGISRKPEVSIGELRRQFSRRGSRPL